MYFEKPCPSSSSIVINIERSDLWRLCAIVICSKNGFMCRVARLIDNKICYNYSSPISLLFLVCLCMSVCVCMYVPLMVLPSFQFGIQFLFISFHSVFKERRFIVAILWGCARGYFVCLLVFVIFFLLFSSLFTWNNIRHDERPNRQNV